MKRFVDNTITLIIGMVMLIAMILVMCGCDSKIPRQPKKPCQCNQGDYAVLVFTADWCASCDNNQNRLEELKSIADVIMVDVESNPKMVKLYNVKSIPLYIVSQRGSSERLRTDDIETVFAHVSGCM